MRPVVGGLGETPLLAGASAAIVCALIVLAGDTRPAGAAPTSAAGSSQIAFDVYRGGNFDIYVMNADGSAQRNLMPARGGQAFPNLSPDGRRIVFVDDRAGNLEIYVMNADGTRPRPLTQTRSDE